MKAAEVTINYSCKIPVKDRYKVTKSEQAVDYMRPIFSPFMEHHEEFYVLLMNRANQVLGIHKVGQGGLSGTIVDVKIIFQAALLANASAMILFHNHPSGHTKPSDADDATSKKVLEAGRLLEIKVLDHCIMTQEGYYSYADEGHIF